MQELTNRLRAAGPVLAVLMGYSASAHADLIGTTVSGAVYYPTSPGVFSPTNYFDPANGLVPSGYANSVSPNNVTIVAPNTTFADVDGGSTCAGTTIASDCATFTGSTITITQTIAPAHLNNISGSKYVFTDTAFGGLGVSPLSDTFSNGGMTAQLSGDTLTLILGPDCLLGSGCSWSSTVQSAEFSLTPVPLPAAAWLMLSGLGGLCALARKANRSVK